ncbi:voltage-dependent T-type calcium channel subunit alpha-1G-like X10, partial [Biomphalaria pfeifferi]
QAFVEDHLDHLLVSVEQTVGVVIIRGVPAGEPEIVAFEVTKPVLWLTACQTVQMMLKMMCSPPVTHSLRHILLVHLGHQVSILM